MAANKIPWRDRILILDPRKGREENKISSCQHFQTISSFSNKKKLYNLKLMHGLMYVEEREGKRLSKVGRGEKKSKKVKRGKRLEAVRLGNWIGNIGKDRVWIEDGN